MSKNKLKSSTDPTKMEKEKQKEYEEREGKEEEKEISSDDDAALKELLRIDEQYAPLLALVSTYMFLDTRCALQMRC